MSTLERRLGTGRAVMIGLASMLGAGLFAVWTPAAALAGPWLLLAVALAGLVAVLNALSVAQLAMRHPVSGGVYAYGRAELGRGWGLAAGALFLAGKTCSAAAIALIVAGYLLPDAAVPLAVALVVVLGTLNLSGVRVTAAVSTVVVVVVIAGLVAALAFGLLGPASDDGTVGGDGTPVWGALPAAGLLFFAFAGYARMATLGEEVREPRRTLPRAILIALGITLALYLALALALQHALGEELASSPQPLAALLPADARWAVALLAALAGLGSLLAILAGLSRTVFALARDGELPGPLARVWARTGAPAVAEIVVGAAAVLGVLLLPVAALVGFSAFTVLGYYAIGHLAALRMPAADRWQPRAIAAAGLVVCLALMAALPWIVA